MMRAMITGAVLLLVSTPHLSADGHNMRLHAGPSTNGPSSVTTSVVQTAQRSAAPKLEKIADGFTKIDTPAWLPREKCLLFTDLEQKKLFQLSTSGERKELRNDGGRGKVGPDGKFYGVLGGRFVSYVPGEEPQTILERGADDRDWALNDVALSAIGLAYVTTLKDPDKGRLSIVNVAQQSIAVAYDGEDVPELSNPNGVAVSPDGKFLVLGVSHYKDRKKSGVHRFPIRNDGSVDVDAGRKSKWADISAPDGIAFGPNGWLYATAGGQVVAVDEHGKKMMEIKIPQGSGTNLTFGGEDGLTLYVTTDKALYATRVAPPDA